MNEYIELIEKLAKEHTNEVFYNSGETHAKVVLNNLINNSESYVETVCGNMCSEIADDSEYLAVVEKYLSDPKKKTYKILFDDYNDDFKAKKIYSILGKFGNQVQVRRLLSKYKHIEYNGIPIHFTVSDSSAFRIETDINKKMAWGNFNDKEKASELHQGFERFFTDEFSEEVDFEIFN
jgi:hypothetical protein